MIGVATRASTVFGHTLLGSLARYTCIIQYLSVTHFDIDTVAFWAALDRMSLRQKLPHEPGIHFNPQVVGSESHVESERPALPTILASPLTGRKLQHSPIIA